MIAQKGKIGAAIVLGALLAFSLFGISYVLFPHQNPTPIPGSRPGDSLIDQILNAFLWIGLAAVIAVMVVGVVLLANRTRERNARQLSGANLGSYMDEDTKRSLTALKIHSYHTFRNRGYLLIVEDPNMRIYREIVGRCERFERLI